MKFVIALAVLLFGGVKAQTGYQVGNLNNVNLPTSLSSSSSSSSSTTITTSTIKTPTFPNADLNKLSELNAGSSSEVSQTTIIRAKNELSSPVDSFQSVFNRFPSDGEISEMVNSGDIGALTRTLQSVATDDSVPCAAKVTYLLNLLGATKDGVRRKTLVADQLVAVIADAKAEIARLTDEIARLQKERDTLRIPDYDSRVNDLSLKLSNFNSQINSIRVQVGPEQGRIMGYERELQNLEKQNDDERNKVINNRVRLAETDSTIKDIEIKIKQARDTRAALVASISNSQNAIRGNIAKIQQIRTKINDIASRIKGLKDTVDNLKRQTNALEVDMERARTNLSTARVKDNKLANDIRKYKNRIEQLQPNVRDDVLRNLRAIVTNLNKVIPSINGDINREYYYCYGAGKVQTITTGSTVVYVVRGDAFGQYISNLYGGNLDSQFGANDSLRLNVVDPFSPIWTSKFGLGYQSGSQGSSSEFSCLGDSSGNVSTGQGRISSIQGNQVVISGQDGRQSRLSVGGCSRVESTSTLPQVGQNVFWRGTPSSNGGYNLYAATCF